MSCRFSFRPTVCTSSIPMAARYMGRRANDLALRPCNRLPCESFRARPQNDKRRRGGGPASSEGKGIGGMATLRDVAREAGVSVATASRAINGLGNVTAPTRAAVMAAVKKLNFVPHSGARSLTRRKTDTVGVILPDLFGEFFSEIIRGIDLVAHESGMHLLLGNMHGSTHETAAAIAAMRGRFRK